MSRDPALQTISVQERPWRLPGADITDYFNYGFNEETWLKYCEMQRKLRAKFGGDATEKLLEAIEVEPEKHPTQSAEATRKLHARARELEQLEQAQGAVRVTRIDASAWLLVATEFDCDTPCRWNNRGARN